MPPKHARRHGRQERSACLTLDLFGVEASAPPDTGRDEPPPAPEPLEGDRSDDAECRTGTPPTSDQASAAAAVVRARHDAEAASLRLPEQPDGGALTADAAIAIGQARIDGCRVTLDSALPREVYQEVAEAFGRIGGRWVRAGRRRDDIPAGYHAFPLESVDLVHAIAETGRLPPRNPTSFFPSPPAVVDLVMSAADLAAADWLQYRFLEPHAGQGAIADRIRASFPDCPLDVVEILDLNRRVLCRKGYDPIAADFLKFDPGPVYDRILANPPFSLPGAPRAYQDHIRHAWDLLKDGGVLVAVAPGGVLGDRKQDREFHRWLADRGTMEELPERAFEASGTGVSTALICLKNRSVGWKREPFMGWCSWNAWQAALWADNDWTLYQDERRLHARITGGDFGRAPIADGANWALAAEVRSLYESGTAELNRRPLYAGVYLDDGDHRELLAHFVGRFHEHHVSDRDDSHYRVAA